MLMYLNNKFLSLEKEAMEMLIESDPENSVTLKGQFSKAAIIERRLTGSGFFTKNYIPNNVQKINRKEEGPLRSAYAKISGLEIGVGFLLFIENGVIDTLECSEYDSIDFPESITEYRLYHSAEKLQ